ncbi:GNAT family N-acetyltransferase [Nitratireductor alexandrii]|uniref:GNAT family N-acetyltransferase n=1 Tax=Nitratireductor alexandrii TaxID=2448161 RepID=UPI000FD70D5F|nr:GNAT family N-acetyltransferase [Nitratireductor alexandrii]
MSGYVGDENQRLLQQRAELDYDWTMNTPGACNMGRLLGTDDPEQLGAVEIARVLERDGAFAFRMIAPDTAKQTSLQMAQLGYHVAYWDMFSADAHTALQGSEAVLDGARASDVTVVWLDADADDAEAARFQRLMHENGITPFSASFLRGNFGHAVTVGLEDASGVLLACGHAYLPHNRFSRYARHAWCGLIAVAVAARRRGLGTLVNAISVRDAVRTLGATHIYEFVSPTNTASRRMVEACGLTPNTGLQGGIATRGQARFTR